VKICVGCGREYFPSSNRQKWCHRCRFKAAPMPGTRPAKPSGQRSCAFCSRSFVPAAWNQRFCSSEHALKANRRPRRAKYETPEHRNLRRSLVPVVALGRTPCARCGKLILPGQDWDLGHDDLNPGLYAGPEHRHSRDCPKGGNRATARHARERRDAEQFKHVRKVSREW